MNRCHWVYDKDVPDGKFLVPGCWHRAIHGNHADCQCEDNAQMVKDRIAALEREIARLKWTDHE